MTIYDTINKAVRDGEMGATYLVDPADSTCEKWYGHDITDHDGSLYWTEEDKVDWPECDYRHEFHASEFLTPKNWEFHVDDYVADGTPFLIQTCAITDITDTEDVDRMNDFIGWALMVKVVDVEKELTRMSTPIRPVTGQDSHTFKPLSVTQYGIVCETCGRKRKDHA